MEISTNIRERIIAYLNGELSNAESKEFENYFINNPEVLEDAFFEKEFVLKNKLLAMRKLYVNSYINKIDDYFDDQLTVSDKIEFERVSKILPEIQEELSFRKELEQSIIINEKTILKGKLKNHENNLRISENNTRFYLKIAASITILFLFITGMLYFRKADLPQTAEKKPLTEDSLNNEKNIYHDSILNDFGRTKNNRNLASKEFKIKTKQINIEEKSFGFVSGSDESIFVKLNFPVYSDFEKSQMNYQFRNDSILIYYPPIMVFNAEFEIVKLFQNKAEWEEPDSIIGKYLRINNEFYKLKESVKTIPLVKLNEEESSKIKEKIKEK